MEPVIKDFPEIKAVGLRYIGKNENNEIPEMWDEFMQRTKEIKNLKKEGYAFGVCSPMSKNTLENGFEYTACLEVNDFDGIPDKMAMVDIPAGKYAVHTYKGKISNIKDIYDYIFGTWRKETKLTVDNDRSDFELYDDRFKGEAHDSEVDIYIPIKD